MTGGWGESPKLEADQKVGSPNLLASGSEFIGVSSIATNRFTGDDPPETKAGAGVCPPDARHFKKKPGSNSVEKNIPKPVSRARAARRCVLRDRLVLCCVLLGALGFVVACDGASQGRSSCLPGPLPIDLPERVPGKVAK